MLVRLRRAEYSLGNTLELIVPVMMFEPFTIMNERRRRNRGTPLRSHSRRMSSILLFDENRGVSIWPNL